MEKTGDIFAEITIRPAACRIPEEPAVPLPPAQRETAVFSAPDREEELEEARHSLRRLTEQTGFVVREEQFCIDAEQLAGRRPEPCAPVPFSAFYPTFSGMTEAQKSFYIYWKQQLLAGDILPADEAYHLLLLYEAVNLTCGLTPSGALTVLKQLYHSAAEQNLDCRKQILQAAVDLILYDGLDMDYLVFAAEIDPAEASEVFDIDVIADPQKASRLGLSLVRGASKACRSRLTESPYYRKHPGRTERALFHLFRRCSLRYEAEGGFLGRFAGQRASFYAPFSHLIFAGNRPCTRNGPYPYSRGRQFAGQNGKLFSTLQGLEWNRQFAVTCSALLKAAECLLREDDHFPGRLKYPEGLPRGLRETVQAAFDDLLAEEQEQKRRQFTLNTGSLKKIRRETDEIRARLIEELAGEEEPEELTEPEEPKEPEEPEAEPTVTLTPEQREILRLLLEDRPIGPALEAAAKKSKTLPLAWMNDLSERLFPLTEDTVMEERDGVWRLYDDYRADLSAYLARTDQHTGGRT